jgi:hypothetical protein
VHSGHHPKHSISRTEFSHRMAHLQLVSGTLGFVHVGAGNKHLGFDPGQGCDSASEQVPLDVSVFEVNAAGPSRHAGFECSPGECSPCEHYIIGLAGLAFQASLGASHSAQACSYWINNQALRFIQEMCKFVSKQQP